MLAAVFEGNGKLTVKEVGDPKLRNPDDVLLEVKAVGICGTDLHILSTPPGHPANPHTILGHEYTAEVIETGKGVTHLGKGDHVVIDPNITCGHCRYCQMGFPNSCENMTTLGIFINGGLARYNVAPARALHKISPDVPHEHAALAEPLSCVVNSAQKARVQPGESVVILGAGPIGLLFAMMFKAAGAGPVIVSESSEFRGGYARKLGADIVVNPEKENLSERVRAETQIGADVVVDAVGNLFGTALPLVRLGGRVVLFGMDQQARPAIKQYDITRNEITVLGSFIALHTFPKAVRLIENGNLDLEALISHKIPLSSITSGLNDLKKRLATKIVVTEL